MKIRALVQESYGSELCYSNKILNSIFNTSTPKNSIMKSSKFEIYDMIPKRIKGLRKKIQGNFGKNLQSSLAPWITCNRNWLISIKLFQSYPSRILMNSMKPLPVCLWMKVKIQKWLKTSIKTLLLKIKKPKGLKMLPSKVP